MIEKKVKKTIKVRDLEPTKDVMGGYRRHRRLFHQREDPRPARRNVNGIFMLPQ